MLILMLQYNILRPIACADTRLTGYGQSAATARSPAPRGFFGVSGLANALPFLQKVGPGG